MTRTVQSVQCVQSLSFQQLIHSSCSCKRSAAGRNCDVDKLLVGGVLRPQLRQSPVDSGVACAGSVQHFAVRQQVELQRHGLRLVEQDVHQHVERDVAASSFSGKRPIRGK